MAFTRFTPLNKYAAGRIARMLGLIKKQPRFSVGKALNKAQDTASDALEYARRNKGKVIAGATVGAGAAAYTASPAVQDFMSKIVRRAYSYTRRGFKLNDAIDSTRLGNKDAQRRRKQLEAQIQERSAKAGVEPKNVYDQPFYAPYMQQYGPYAGYAQNMASSGIYHRHNIINALKNLR